MIPFAMQKSSITISVEHMKENLSVYEFQLSDDDMEIINHLKNGAKGFHHLDVRQME